MVDEIYIIDSAVMQGWGDLVRENTNTEDKLLPNELLEKTRENWGNGGEEIYFTPNGVGYTKNMELSVTGLSSFNQYNHATHMESISLPDYIVNSVPGVANLFSYCSALKDAYLPKLTYAGHYIFRECTALKTCQLGSIGYPVTSMAIYTFYLCKQDDLIITLYVDADKLTDIPIDVTANAPWGATNATIIYRNSTTGEVIES